MAVGRGFERPWRPVHCQIHRPSSVVSGRPRREPSRRHGGQSGASCVQHCGRPDPPSAKRSCAGVKFSGLQTACCIQGITDAACSRAAAVPPSPNRRRIPSPDSDSCQTRFRACYPSCGDGSGFGPAPGPPRQRKPGPVSTGRHAWFGRVWNSSRRIYFELLFNYPLQVCVISEESPPWQGETLLR